MADRTFPIFLAAGLCALSSPALASHMTAQQAASSKQAVSDALNHLSLTPIQRISIRDYVGQGKFDITSFNTPTGQALMLSDPETHAYMGEAIIRTASDGSVYVDKTTGATFAWNKPTVEVPLLNRRTEEAESVLTGSEDTNVFNSKPPSPDSRSLTVPAISVDGGVQVGAVRQSVAVFQKDGHGYEEGLSTNLGSAGAGVSAGAGGEAESGKGFAGVKGEIGAKLTKVELFVNYFGAPTADEKGEFTRSVIGGSYEMHGTLANAEGKLGCFENEGCTGDWSAGALGVGMGFGVKYGSAVKLQMEPEKVEGSDGLIDTASNVDSSSQDADDETEMDDEDANADDSASQPSSDDTQAQPQPDDQAHQPEQTQDQDDTTSSNDNQDQTQTDDQAQQPDQTQDQDDTTSSDDTQDQTQTDDQAQQPDQTQDQDDTTSSDDNQDQTQTDDQAQQPDQTQDQDDTTSSDDNQDQTQTDDQVQQPDQTQDQDDTTSSDDTQGQTQTDDQAQQPDQTQDQDDTTSSDDTQDQTQTDDQVQEPAPQPTQDETPSSSDTQTTSQSSDTSSSSDSGGSSGDSDGGDSGGDDGGSE